MLLNTSGTFHLLMDCSSTDLPGDLFLVLVNSKLGNFIYTVVVPTPCYFYENGDDFGIHLRKFTKGITAEEMIPVK